MFFVTVVWRAHSLARGEGNEEINHFLTVMTFLPFCRVLQRNHCNPVRQIQSRYVLTTLRLRTAAFSTPPPYDGLSITIPYALQWPSPVINL